MAQDDARAAAWFRRAAEQGHGPAQLQLAERYRAGLGVPRDEAQARYWLRRAASTDEIAKEEMWQGR